MLICFYCPTDTAKKMRSPKGFYQNKNCSEFPEMQMTRLPSKVYDIMHMCALFRGAYCTVNITSEQYKT